MLSTNSIKEFGTACRRGLPMSGRFLWRSIQVVLILVTVAGVFTAPWYLSLINNVFWRSIIWVFIIIIILVMAISIGLMPYFGQREITKDEKNHSQNLENYLNQERQKLAECERQVAELKQKLNM